MNNKKEELLKEYEELSRTLKIISANYIEKIENYVENRNKKVLEDSKLKLVLKNIYEGQILELETRIQQIKIELDRVEEEKEEYIEEEIEETKEEVIEKVEEEPFVIDFDEVDENKGAFIVDGLDDFKPKKIKNELIIDGLDEVFDAKEETKVDTFKELELDVQGAFSNTENKTEKPPKLSREKYNVNYKVENDKIIVEKRSDLLRLVYNLIIDNTNSINLDVPKADTKIGYINLESSYGNINLNDLDNVELSSGDYLSEKDILYMIHSLYENYKGATFVVEDTSKEYKITKSTIKKFEKSLKECSGLKISKRNMTSRFDALSIYAKNKGTAYFEEEPVGKIYIGNLMPTGSYYKDEEVILNFISLFTNKKLLLLKSFKEKITEENNQKKL